MPTLLLDAEPVAVGVAISGDSLSVELRDGRTIVVPLDWYPRLQHATERERGTWTLLAGGYAIEWPALDEHIGVEGLLAGRRSGESTESLARWLADRNAAGVSGQP